MASTKRPTHIELQPDDAAFLIRAGGELEMLMPDRQGDELMPEDCLVLAGFALGFRDEGVRSLMGQILREKRN